MCWIKWWWRPEILRILCFSVHLWCMERFICGMNGPKTTSGSVCAICLWFISRAFIPSASLIVYGRLYGCSMSKRINRTLCICFQDDFSRAFISCWRSFLAVHWLHTIWRGRFLFGSINHSAICVCKQQGLHQSLSAAFSCGCKCYGFWRFQTSKRVFQP
jgi:hypothetical protein